MCTFIRLLCKSVNHVLYRLILSLINSKGFNSPCKLLQKENSQEIIVLHTQSMRSYHYWQLKKADYLIFSPGNMTGVGGRLEPKSLKSEWSLKMLMEEDNRTPQVTQGC